MVCGTWGKDGGHRRGKGGATNRVAARNRFGGRTAEVTLETCSYVRGSQTKWDSKDKRMEVTCDHTGGREEWRGGWK